MTQTERIRAELQEREIEFYEYDMGHIHGVPPTLETTWTAASGLSVTYVECPGGATRMRVWEPSASQALDMAGRGECKLVYRKGGPLIYQAIEEYACSRCGNPMTDHDSYCSECGAKVVVE